MNVSQPMTQSARHRTDASAGRQRRRIALAALAAVCLLPAPVSAQSDQGLGDLSLEDLMNVKVETVVGASKYRQRVTEAPASVTIISSDEIQRHQYRTLADVLRNVRGFYVTYDRNYHYVGTRGFIRPGDYNSRILVLIDGHRLNDSIFGGALIGQELPVPVDLIDRVEVIRGPGSSMYGSSALFGVVNVITKSASQAPGGEAWVAGGGQQTGGATFSYGRLSQSGTSVLIGGSAYRSAGVADLFFPEYADGALGSGHALDVDRTTRGNGMLNLSRGGLTVRAVYGVRRKNVPTGAFGAVFNDPRSRTLDTQGYVDVSYTRAWTNGTEVTSRLFGDHYEYDGFTPYAVDDATVLNHDLARGTWWGGEVRASRRVRRDHRLTVGTELRHDARIVQQNYDVDPRQDYLDDRQNLSVRSFFAEGEWRLLRSAVLQTGVRHDDYSLFGGQTKPRVALIVNPAARTTLKLVYGGAFRAPTVYELYWRQASVTKASPDLRPENIDATELVLEQYVGAHWRLSMNGFTYQLRGLVDQTEDPADGLLVYRNLNAVNAKGFEVEAEGRWARDLRIRVSQTLQRSVDPGTDERLTNSPTSVFQAAIESPIGRTGLTASMDLQALSGRRTLVGTWASSYAVTNLTVSTPRIGRRLEVNASIWNLFGSVYGDPGSEEHRQTLIPQDGRTVGVKARVQF